jgi:transcriptional regulator with XRE-family HTH domain
MKEKVAERIRLARLSKNLSQQNMADELNITVAAYSNIERGITDISITRLYQVAAILGANPLNLIKENQEYSIGDSSNPTENYSTSLTQQVYMLIQQVQQLNARVDFLGKEVEKIKGN